MDPDYVFNKSLPYLTGRLEDAGLTVQVGFNQTKGTIFLLLNDSVKCSGQVLWSGVIVLCPSEWVMRSVGVGVPPARWVGV